MNIVASQTLSGEWDAQLFRPGMGLAMESDLHI
jgi:hypothetical protein